MATVECATPLAAPGAAEMTAADLDRHRIGEAEKDLTDLTAVVRSLEREVDRLKIEQAAGTAGLARLEGKLDERDKNVMLRLEKLHARLDERLSEVAPASALEALSAKLTDAREVELRAEGAKAENRRLWKAWLSITMAAVGVGGVIIAVLTLALR